MLVALFACTWFVLTSSPPDRFSAASADGNVLVSGAAAASLAPLVVTERDESVQPLVGRVGSVYEISLGGLALPRGFLLVVSYDPSSLGSTAPNHLAIEAFDRARNAWTALPSVVDPSAHTVTATSSGTNATLWTIGIGP
ncbi:hypothetical protein EBS80_04365 [bacterium]|nr:hypothetical protein [bacterium]